MTRMMQERGRHFDIGEGAIICRMRPWRIAGDSSVQAAWKGWPMIAAGGAHPCEQAGGQGPQNMCRSVDSCGVRW